MARYRALDRVLAVFGLQRRALTLQQWLVDWMGGGTKTGAGVSVTEDVAMSQTAVYACVRILAEAIACLPLRLYRERADGGKDRVLDHPLTEVIRMPHPEMTGVEWRECMQGHVALRGNAFSQIVRRNNGDVVELSPLKPDKIEMKRTPTGGIAYVYHLDTGGDEVFRGDEILHLRGLSTNGLWGISPITQNRETIGLAIGEQAFAARFFGNGATPGGVLKYPGQLDDQQFKRLQEAWEARHQGPDHAHRMAILEDGLEWQQTGISAEDAQLLESRRFSVAEIARIFRVPLPLIQEHEKSTSWGTGIEQFNIQFVVHTLMPWLVRWEKRLDASLLTPEERAAGMYFRHSVAGLLRGDYKTRMEGYKIAIETGIMCPDEARALEDMNPRTDGNGGIYADVSSLAREPAQNEEEATEEDQDDDENEAD
ncbi:MAG: phage portal protein [Pseudomonadota bacterium]